MADWTIIKILEWTESYFKRQSHPNSGSTPNEGRFPSVHIDSPRLTAEILLAHILNLKRIDLYLQHDRPLEAQELSDFKNAIKRRATGEPVAYITGVKGFYESEFTVTPGVLIPRPDTETLVEEALKSLRKESGKRKPKRILEMGVGSGAVIISMAKAEPGHFYAANDISDSALAAATRNNNKIIHGEVQLFKGSWFSAIRSDAGFDLIVSNPPYIPSNDIQTLQPEVSHFEPLTALDGGADGLDCYRLILDQAHQYLLSGGEILVEIGFGQRGGLEAIFETLEEYQDVKFIKDLAGHDRVAKFKKID